MSDTPKSFDEWWNSEPKNEAGIEYGLDEYHLLREGWRACIEHRAKPLERENADLRAELQEVKGSYEMLLQGAKAELEQVRKDAEAMKAATYSHVDGRDLLHQLQPNGAHHIDILVRINGQDRRYQGDWLKKLTWARDGHNMGEYADNPQLRALIEQRRKEGPQEVGVCCGSIDAAIAQGKGEK